MSMIYVLIPLAVVLIAAAVWALVWAIRTGQFDDLDAQGWSVVLDDDEKPPESARAEPAGDLEEGEVTFDDREGEGGP